MPKETRLPFVLPCFSLCFLTFSFKLSRTVDLGQISSENLVFAREALLKGRPVYMKDEEQMNLLRANLLGMYIQYNLDRKEVVDAYTV